MSLLNRLLPFKTAPQKRAVPADPLGDVKDIVERAVATMPPDEALRLLFQIDAYLYARQGGLAVAYGKGVHTKHRHTRYHDFFIDRIGPEERVIDLGCGIGALAQDIAERSGAFVLGIDLNAGSIEQAKERFAHPRAEYRQGDILIMPLPGSFDVVVMSNVLEHLPGRPEFLRKLQQVVGPKRILIRVPLFDREWRVPLKQELGVEWRLDPTHETEYTLDSFNTEMDAAGLVIDELIIRWGEIWAVTHARDA